MFKWIKKGMIFSPDKKYPWMVTHAQVPYSLEFERFLRVYFSTREKYSCDGLCRSFTGYVDFDKNDFGHILDVSSIPVIDLGNIGEFDECGTMAGSIIKSKDKYLLYYCGWNRSVSTPYTWGIGLADSSDGKSFKKIGPGPIVGPSLYEPYLQACPIVYKYNENEWHMFYLSGINWIKYDNKLESQYLLMHATSDDGVLWKRNHCPIIEPIIDNECQTSCSIININNTYHMFFSYRHGTDFRHKCERGYRIGYAYSNDLINWARDDSKVGIDVSESGWDSEMICYPHIAKINGKYIMFYCGNGFGREGFGYAELEI